MIGESEPQYDAFISYSHAVDSRLAPKLEAALEGFAKKWYRRRALRTFRDKTGLSATPALWPAIERALDQSRHFVLLASPESAASVWVQREVAWWLANRSVHTLLIALTSGELVWNNAAADFHETLSSSIPPVLRGRFPEEPLYVDLRWARDEEQLSLRHSQFRTAVIDLAATLHGRPRDELDGDDLRQHRRFKAAAWTAACALAILAVVSSAAGYAAMRNARLAEAQRKEAERQRAEAERQRDFAMARQLVAESDRMVLEHPLDFERAALLTAVSLQRARFFENDLAARERLELLPEAPVILQHGGVVRALALSSDGSAVLTGGEDGVAHIWQRDSGRDTKQFRHGSAIWAVAFGADGRHFFTAGADGAIRDWETEAGRSSVAVSFDVHPGEMDLVAFSSDGSRAVTVYTAEDFGAAIQIWDLPARQRLNQILFGQIVTSVSLDEHGERLLAGTWAKSVHMWNAKTGEEIGQLDVSDRVEAVAFGVDGAEIVIATSDRMVRVASARSDLQEVASFRHPTGVDRVALFGTHQVLTGASESSALWDAATGTELVRVSHLGPVRAVAFSKDGSAIATASDDGSARVWLTQAGKHSRRLSCGSSIPQVLVNADGRHVDASAGLFLVGRCIHEGGDDGAARVRGIQDPDAAVLSSDGKILAVVENRGRVAIFDAATRLKISTVNAASDSIWGIAITRDGRQVAAVSGQESWRGRAHVWESVSGRSTATFDYPREGLYSIGFSPDGRRLVIGVGDSSRSSGEARILDLSTGRMSMALKTGGGRTRTVSYSADGRRLLTAGEGGSVKIWDAESGKEEVTVTPGSTVFQASWSEDGSRIATASFDGLAQVWDAKTGEELTRIRHRQPVHAVAFFPDGSSLVTAGEGFLEIHGLRAETLILQLCERIRRNLTSAEWRRYFGTIPYEPTCGNLPGADTFESGVRDRS